MAKNSKVETQVFPGLRLSVTSEQLATCRAKHIGALEANIKGSSAPADGAILTIINTLAALDTVIPMDDPAGRGLDAEVSE